MTIKAIDFSKRLYCVHRSKTLETFYMALGSPTILNLVQDDVRLGNIITEREELAQKIHKRILERSKLFLHEYPPADIKHDARWLEKNLTVEMVSNITMRRSLRGYTLSHTAKLTATLKHEPRKGWILWITPSYDMYHVSQALVTQLLTRPSNQATTLFEFLLVSDLQGLKRRGYNVERILRAQAVESRIAENERQKQLEIEQKQIKEQEEQWKQSQMVPAAAREGREEREDRRKSGQVAMPGAFGNDSPENSPVIPPKKPRGIFSGLTRRLGIDGSEAQQQLQNFLGGGGPAHQEPEDRNKPPPYDESTQGVVPQPRSGGRQPGETEKVTSPHALHQNLVNAIQSSRAHDSSTLFSPPTTSQVKEQASYCDATPSHNITHIGDAQNGMRIFIAKDLTIPAVKFLSDNASSIKVFSVLLQEVAGIYALPRKAMHMFYDEAGSTIAFNSQGSIFCNLRFFNQLHARKMGDVEGKTEATSWWWVVVAHELAHNLVSDHSAEHSYYWSVSHSVIADDRQSATNTCTAKCLLRNISPK
jgi:hypothetical protein